MDRDNWISALLLQAYQVIASVMPVIIPKKDDAIYLNQNINKHTIVMNDH